MSNRIKVNCDIEYAIDGRFFSTDAGCGCCSSSYQLTPKEALEEVRDSIAELLVMESLLVKVLKDNDE